MKNKLKFIFVFFVATIQTACVNAQSTESGVEKNLEVIKQEGAIVSFSSVSMPLGKVVFIKNKDYLCTVKFLNYTPEVLDESETKYATVEFNERLLHGSYFNKSDEKSIKLKSSGYTFIGHMPKPKGDFTLKCGNFEVFWKYPTTIIISEDPKLGIGLYPSSCENAHDASLKYEDFNWFYFDQSYKRYNKTVPKEELLCPKRQ